jgi:hypothetical protein
MTFAQEINGALVIPAYWQSAWNAMYNVMNIFGSISAGLIQDRFGRRMVFLLAIVFASAGIAIAYIAENSAQFLGSKICTGLSMGMIVATTQTYVSEISPLPMRGILLSFCTIMMVSRTSYPDAAIPKTPLLSIFRTLDSSSPYPRPTHVSPSSTRPHSVSSLQLPGHSLPPSPWACPSCPSLPFGSSCGAAETMR